jgi:hypothetical protein
MYVYHNIEACSCNHCSSGKAVSITYSESLFVAVCFQYIMRMRQIVICGLSISTVFFPQYFMNGKIFEQRFIEHKL